MIKGIAGAYQRLCDESGQVFALPKLTPVGATIRPKALDRGNLGDEVKVLCRFPGWVRFQSGMHRTGDAWTWPATDGLPLIGEWALSDKAGAHLRQNDSGGWTLYRYEECACLDTAAEQYLCQEISLIAADMPAKAQRPDALIYHVYWTSDGGVMRRAFARFAGFSAVQTAKAA
jgi:hypothetical protein